MITEREYERCLEDIASNIMFGSGSVDLKNIIKDKIEFRKNKNVDSIKEALRKAYNKKTYKTEQEFSWFVLYLKDVFKKSR